MARLTSEMVRDWLKTQYPDIYIAAGRTVDMPDRVIAVQRVGGTNVILEGAFEVITFRVEMRGASNSLANAEELALSVDSFVWGHNNFDIGDVRVTSVGYASPLRQLNITDSQSRYLFSADYQFRASRED